VVVGAGEVSTGVVSGVVLDETDGENGGHLTTAASVKYPIATKMIVAIAMILVYGPSCIITPLA
jgi:hypothetical protein